jgi:type II secretory pathway component PulF
MLKIKWAIWKNWNDMQIQLRLTLLKIKKVVVHWYLKSAVFTHTRRINLYRNLQMLTGSGISLNETVRLLASKYRKYMPASLFPLVLEDWLKSMAQGHSFFHALSPWVPGWELLLLRAGGATQVTHMLKYVAELSSNIIKLKSGLIAALRYPMATVLMLCALLGAFSYYLVPNLSSFMPPDKFPPITKNLVILTTAFTDHLFLTVIMVALIVAGLSYSLGHVRTGQVRRILNFFPPWNVYKQFHSSIFLLSLSALLRSGISFGHALETIRSASSPYIASVIIMMQTKLQAGKRAGEAIQSDLFDKETKINLEVYADTDKLEEGIFVLAEEQLETQITKLANTAKVLGNLILLIVVGFICWVYMAIIALQSSMGSQ